MGKCKKVIKKTGHAVSAPIRIPVKKIKRHHQKKKIERQIKKAVNESADVLKDLFTSEEFVNNMQQMADAVTSAFNAASGADDIVVDVDPV